MMTIVALAFVWRFGNDVPFWDEWNIIDALAGAQRMSIEWLWARITDIASYYRNCFYLDYIKSVVVIFASGCTSMSPRWQRSLRR